jgi:ABC-type sugar transport system ATPase subunit
MIRIESLTASFGEFRLEDVSLEVDSGTSLVVLGPSGSGKTMLLETFIGLRQPLRGRILVDGRDVTKTAPEKRGISYLPQDVALFPHLSVRQNILFGAAAGGRARSLDRELNRLAELLGIGYLLERRDVRSLSAGEAQRVAFARALFVRPRILVSDESFSSLDAPLRRQLQHEFRHLQHDLGLTVLHVTHDQEEAFLLGDRVAVLMDGQIMQVASPADLYARPNSIKIARFLGIGNVWPLDGSQDTDSLLICRVGPLMLKAPLPERTDAKPTHIAVAASEVELADSECICPGENRFPAAITAACNLGHCWLVKLAIDGLGERHLECAVSPTLGDRIVLNQGSVVHVHIRPSSIRVFRESQDAEATASVSPDVV